MDKDGYPEEHELKKIREWDYRDCSGLMEYVQSLWRWAERQISAVDTQDELSGKPVIRYSISTGGWSGNEDIIGAMFQNRMFWSLCWVQSRRGGHYIFEVKK